MRNKIGILLMLIGTAFICGALYLFLHNNQEDRTAEAYVQNLMPVIYQEIHTTREEINTVPVITQSENLENKPIELLTPEDLTMTEKEIDGYFYIGYLEIPELDLILPVMSDWSMNKLRVSPCRFSGTVLGEDLVIMAHNYKSHFGRLSKLSMGSQVIFTDMDGKVWEYEVVATDILPAEAVEEMISGEYDLTLFTCAPNRTHRVTIRCDKTSHG